MSSNDLTSQFFPAHLKWASIIFFMVIGIIAVAIALTTPQSLRNEFKTQVKSKGQSDTSLLRQAEVKSATSAATQTPNSPTMVQQSQPSSPNKQPASTSIAVNETVPEKSPANTNTPPPNKEQVKNCSNPMVKGVITSDGSKIYYTKGNQRYFSIDKWAKLVEMFCTEDEARTAGWHEAPR